MNELQITLLVLAIVFIGGLYFLGQRRKSTSGGQAQNAAAEENSHADSAGTAAATASPSSTSPQQDLFEQPGQDMASGDRIYEENGKLVIEVDGESAVSPSEIVETRTNFGRPQSQAGQADNGIQDDKPAATREPQLFAIMVLGSHTYDARTIRHALMAQGMVYDEKEQIFVMRDEEGRIYLRAANAWNPGILPDHDDPEFKTPGVALILQLPTCIPAPAAMEDMIKVARKLSQRLRAHLYRMDRQHMTESDIRAMRQAALDYVSEPLK